MIPQDFSAFFQWRMKEQNGKCDICGRVRHGNLIRNGKKLCLKCAKDQIQDKRYKK